MLKTASQIANAVLLKLADESQMDPSLYEDTPSKKRHWPLGAAGLLAGGAAAHYGLPSQMTRDYRDAAKGLEEKAVASREAHKPFYDPKAERYTQTLPDHSVMVNDVTAKGSKVRFGAPAHAAQQYFKNRAWAEAMPRTLLGAGLGLGAGILGSSMLQ